MGFLIVVVVVIALVVLFLGKNKTSNTKVTRTPSVLKQAEEDKEDKLFTEKCPLIKRKLMTKNEQALYKVIKECMPEVLIFSQVQLSQMVFYPKYKEDFKGKMYWHNRICRMSADLVLTNELFEILAVIELDDSSHKKPDRIQQDLKKDKVLKDADLNLIRIAIDNQPSGAELRKLVFPEA